MSFSLAFKNIKKSIKDYSIYFFTLVVAVCIFYTFNSLDAQKSILIMSESKYEIVDAIIYILNYVSIFISVILGFLIIYSNNYLIKRRKKEFGLYLTLGMSKKKVSAILVIETLLVGLISLGIGLIFGVVLSQFLSIFTAKLFEINMESFKFIFSSSALVKTIIYFGIIFVLVMLFNVISLSKNRLINLLTADKKNEKVKIRNGILIIITFILSISLLSYAYYLLFNGGMFAMDNKLIFMLASGAIGTYLLFFSISGFFLKIIKKNKKIYYNNLNIFVLKQIDSKSNKTVLSTTIISLMLLLTIGILSGAISLVSVMNDDINSNNRTDFTIIKNSNTYVVDDQGKYTRMTDSHTVEDIADADWFNNYVKDYVVYHLFYDKNVTINSLVDEKVKKEIRESYGNEVMFDTPLPILAESDYNKIMNLYGLKAMDIKEDEYYLTSNIDKAIEMYINNYKNDKRIILGGSSLKPATNEIGKISFDNYSTASNMGILIVDDSNIKGLVSDSAYLIGNYINSKDIKSLEEEFFIKCSYYGSITYTTKLEMKESNVGIKAIMTFVGLYLGIIFAITSATVLAIGQLSESSDNKKRFMVLKQIGADNKNLNKALLIQIGIAFITPLFVAIIHAIFGLRELNNMIELLGHINLSKSIGLTSLFIIIIYGGYFVATYLCSKNIIKE